MTVGNRVITGTGVEYIDDIYGCDPDLLRCGAPRDRPWETRLLAWFEADHVDVQTLDRGRRLPSDRFATGSDSD